MGQGSTFVFNLVSIVFVVLTIVAVIVIFAIAGGAMDPPFLSTQTPEPSPTLFPSSTPPPPEPMATPTVEVN